MDSRADGRRAACRRRHDMNLIWNVHMIVGLTSPLVGSSRKSARGCVTSSMPTLTRRFSPAKHKKENHQPHVDREKGSRDKDRNAPPEMPLFCSFPTRESAMCVICSSPITVSTRCTCDHTTTEQRRAQKRRRYRTTTFSEAQRLIENGSYPADRVIEYVRSG